MTITVGTGVATSSTTSSAPPATLADTTIGALNVMDVSANSTGTGVQPQINTPSGWTLDKDSWKTGSPSHEIARFFRFYQSGDPTTLTVTIAAAGGGNIAVQPWAFSAGMIDTTTPVVTGESAAAQSAGPTTNVTSAVTLGGSRYVATAFGNRGGATWSAAADGNIHDAILGQKAQGSAASIASCCSGSPTSSGAARSLLSSTSTSVNNTIITAFNPAASGTTATVTMAGTSTMDAPGSQTIPAATTMAGAGAMTANPQGQTSATVTMAGAGTLGVTPATPIIAALQTTPTWVAHRGGYAATLGEGTLEAYQAAAAQYRHAFLEIPIRDTSDGVYVVSHDATLSRVFGNSSTINSVTWATLSPNGASTVGRPTTINGGNPLRRLEEILDAFPASTFPGIEFVVENKHGTNQAGVIALLNAHAAGRWMFKGPNNDTANAAASAAAGAPCWLYFYPDASLQASQGVTLASALSTAWSAMSAARAANIPVLFGFGDYSSSGADLPSSQTDANTFFAFTTANGIKSWAHIINTPTQKTTADSQATTAGGAHSGYMVSGFAAVAPVDATTATLTMAGAGSMGAAGTEQHTATVAISGAGSLSATGAGQIPSTVAMAGGGTITAVVSTSAPAGPAPAVRVVVVAAENRVLTVAAEQRVATVPAEVRTIPVA